MSMTGWDFLYVHESVNYIFLVFGQVNADRFLRYVRKFDENIEVFIYYSCLGPLFWSWAKSVNDGVWLCVEGHLVDSVLKQCLWEIGGVQALDFKVAPKFKRSRAPNCGDGDHQPKGSLEARNRQICATCLSWGWGWGWSRTTLRRRMKCSGIFVALSPFLRPPTHDKFFSVQERVPPNQQRLGDLWVDIVTESWHRAKAALQGGNILSLS